MSQPEPGDWSFLPHDPLAFFGLEEEFDRRDLKRAYGVLIRKFRPETHPAEFQRIRQAYEHLDRDSRYGFDLRIANEQFSAWQPSLSDRGAGHSQNTSDASSTEHSAANAQRTAIELAIAEPLETYRRLELQTSKSPQDYYLLALLSDVAGESRTWKFLTWLLAGLKAHPHDVGLRAVIAEHLRVDVPLAEAPKVLVTVAKSISSDIYYGVTEPLWDRLLFSRPFAEFQPILAQCEQVLRLMDLQQRAIFYLRVLRAAVWTAHPQWVDQTIAMVETQAMHFDDASELEFEFILLVNQYVRTGRQRSSDSPVRKRLDAMIRLYCTTDSQSSAAAVVTTQDRLARDAHGLMEAFPFDDSSFGEDSDLLAICMILADNVAAQTGLDYTPAADNALWDQAKSTIQDFKDSIPKVERDLNWLWRVTYWPLIVMLIIGGGAVGIIHEKTKKTDSLAGIFGLGTLLFLICAFVHLNSKYIEPWLEKLNRQVMLRHYRHRWRPRLFRYVHSCGHAETALPQLRKSVGNAELLTWMDSILGFASMDSGLVIYSRAQAFVT